MKKRLKTYLAILFSFVLMINTVSVSAEMPENDINQDLPTVESLQNTEEVQNADVEDSQDSDTSDISNLNDDIEVTEESSHEETNPEVTETEQEVTESEQDNTSEVTSAEESTAKEVTTEEAAFDETEEAATEASEVESVNMPEFSGFKIVDGVIVLVTAPEGVFPEGSTLSVAKVNEEEQKDVDDAVDKTRDENLNVAVSYTYDIKVLDNNGNEIQPADGKKVNVSFALEETANENLNADVYHITEENGELAAEVLETSEQGSLVIAESDGFSYYTVEFTYNEKQYVMDGDSEVPLTDILDYVGITKADGSTAVSGDVTAVSVSDESLFSASDESGEWIVTAHQAFTSNEWMKVTVDGVEYEIVVTDDEAQYQITVTVSNVVYSAGSIISVAITFNNWLGANLPVSYTYDSNTIPDTIQLYVTLKNPNGATQQPYSANVSINEQSAILPKGAYTGWSNPPENVTIYYSVSIIERHTHSWTYSANGNIITAHCNGSGTCPVGDQTLTLGTVSDKMYNGTAQTTPSYTTTDGWTASNGLEESGSVTVTPENSANVGTYTASVSVGGAKATSSWTISRADISPSITIADWTYGGTASNPTLSGNTGNGAVTWSYKVKGAADSTYTSTKPSNAGEYTVRAVVAQTANYNGKTVTKDFKITKKNLTVTAKPKTITYGAAPANDGVTYSGFVNSENASVLNGTLAYSYSYSQYENVGSYTITPSGLTSNNYNISFATGTLTVTKKEVTLSWSDNTFTYNGLPQAPTATIYGVINNDDCAVSVSGAQTNYSGAAYTATAELIGERAGNYALPTAHTMTFTIGKKDATITASDQTITYGEAIATGTGYITTYGFVSEDLPTAITLTQNTSDVTTSGTITPSAATIKNGTTDVTDNYNIAYHTGNLTINKKTITISGITASNKTYDGTTAATLSYDRINWTACGMVAGDDLSVTATGTFSDADVGTGKTVTITDLALGGTKTGNYELAANGQQTSTTADINKKAITITADSDSKVYDGTAHKKNSYSITSGGLAVGDSIESVTVIGSQTFVGNSNNVPDAAVIKNSSDVNVTGNYDITYTNGTLTITKKPLTITADSDTKVYDATALTNSGYTSTGLAEGDTFESVTVTGSQTSVGSSDNEPSEAVIKNGTNQDVTSNYNITYANGMLEVTGKPVTITADSDSKIYDGSSLTKNSYTNTALAEGDYIDSVTISGSQTTVGNSNNVPSGAVIKNSSNEDVTSSYSISYANGTLEVTGKALTITADSDSKVYDGTELTKNGYTNTALAEGDYIDSVTVTGTQTVAGDGTNVPSEAVIKNSNGDDVTASYDITYVNGTLEVTKKAVTITADDATKVYDGTALTKDSYTNSDLAAGDTIESVTVTGSQTNAGQSANAPSEAVIKNAADEDVTASYDITYVDGTLEVTKKPVTIDGITAKDKTYDGITGAELDYTNIDWLACGMVDGDELSVTATGTFEDTSVGTNKNVAITDITLGGTSIDNYILSEDGQQTTATATINKKAVTVTALKQTVAVNGEIESLVDMAELSGALEGHELAEITLTSSSTEKTTTEGVITPSNAKIVNGDTDVTDNYDITYIDGVMTVTKAEAEVVLDNGDDEAPASVTAVEVPNLLELADEEAEEGRLVKVELSVKPVSESKVSEATVSDVKKTVESLFAFVDMESVRVEYLEIDLTKYVDNVKEGAISDTGKPLEIILTYDTSKAGNPVIIRNHEGAVIVFTQLSARPTGSFTDATYYVEGDKIYMYSQYFSDFAIAYSVEKTFNVILDDGNGNIIRQIVSEGTKFIPPTDITKDGYDFDGWYKDEAFTEKWNPEKDKVASDIMLYAKWEKQKEETPTTTEAPATTEETTETTTETTIVPDTKVDTPEANVETPKSDTPKAPTTGDKMNIGVIVILMIGSALAALYLTLRRRLMK